MFKVFSILIQTNYMPKGRTDDFHQFSKTNRTKCFSYKKNYLH